MSSGHPASLGSRKYATLIRDRLDLFPSGHVASGHVAGEIGQVERCGALVDGTPEPMFVEFALSKTTFEQSCQIAPVILLK